MLASIVIAFIGTSITLCKACSIPARADIERAIVYNQEYRRAQTAVPNVGRVAISNISYFNGTGFVGPNATVVIEGSTIKHITKHFPSADPSLPKMSTFNTDGAAVIDGQGGFLIPGLIDSHAHPVNVTDLATYASYGVSTIMTMSCYTQAACDSLRNHTGLPDVRVAGVPAAAPNSTHALLAQRQGAPSSLTLSTPGQASAFVDAQIAIGADYIKIIVEREGGPTLSQETLNGIVKSAHGAGYFTVTHAVTQAAYRMAALSGSDMIHHSPLDSPIAVNDIALFVQRQLVSVPTLSIMAGFAQSKIYPGDNYAAANDTVASLHQAGVTILAGTDANAVGGGLPIVPFGASLHAELRMMVQAGMTELEVLNAATTLPAKFFGLGDRGCIRTGAKADLVLLGANPLVAINNTRSIQRVWISGMAYQSL